MIKERSLGIGLSFVLGLPALILGQFFPIIGSSIFALVIGILVNELVSIPSQLRPGLNWSGKKLLQYSIIFMGFSMPISRVASMGISSLKISIPTISIAFIASLVMGKILHMNPKLRTLIGFGTAICGGSAIAAAAPIIEAEEEEIALSLSTIFFFNILAVFIFPVLGHLWQMSNFQFGLWSGTAINDTSSVVAAAFSYSQKAGEIATIVKLTRALMIIPICFGLLALRLFKNKEELSERSVLKNVIPWFIFLFLGASIVSSIGIVPNELLPLLKWISQLFMAMALVGIGSKVSWKQFRSAGVAPLLLGVVAWFCVAASSLLLQLLFY